MNKEYNLKLDLQFKCNNSKMIFDEFDENTSDFFMQINRQGEKVDISNAIPTLLVLKPSGIAVSQILNVKDNLVYGNLNNSLKNEVGTYIAKLMLVERDKKTFISNISYEVTENALLGKIDNDIVEDERYSALLQLLERLSNIELQEQTRVDNESSRIEAEQNREQTFQNLQDEVKDLLDKGLDLSSLATKEELNELSEELETHVHNEYALKKEIPTKISNLENDSNYLTEIPSDYITETELNTKGYLTEHQDIRHLATKKELFSKDYNDLTNKPTIPSIDGLATKIYVNEEIEKIDVTSQLGDYAKKSDIPVVPTKISAFSNDKGYLTSVPGEYVTETELNAKGYLTEHQDISGLATKEYVDDAITNLSIDIDYDSLLAFDTEELIKYPVGYFDVNNLIVLDSDALLPGTYSLKYKYEDGSEMLLKNVCVTNNENKIIDVLEEGIIYLNKRFGGGAGGVPSIVDAPGQVVVKLPIASDGATLYTLNINNSPRSLVTYKDFNTLQFTNADETTVSVVNGSTHFGYMNEGWVVSTDGKTLGACVFTPNADMSYMYLTLMIKYSGDDLTITEADFGDLTITLKIGGDN